MVSVAKRYSDSIAVEVLLSGFLGSQNAQRLDSDKVAKNKRLWEARSLNRYRNMFIYVKDFFGNICKE